MKDAVNYTKSVFHLFRHTLKLIDLIIPHEFPNIIYIESKG